MDKKKVSKKLEKESYANVLKLQTQIIKRLDKIENYIKFQVYLKILKYIIVIAIIVLGTYFAIPVIQNFYEQYSAVMEQLNGIKSSNIFDILK